MLHDIHGRPTVVYILNSDCRLPSFTEEQKRLLKGTADFLGLNFYSVSFAEHNDLSQEENVTWGYFTDQEMKASRDPTWLKGQCIKMMQSSSFPSGS